MPCRSVHGRSRRRPRPGRELAVSLFWRPASWHLAIPSTAPPKRAALFVVTGRANRPHREAQAGTHLAPSLEQKDRPVNFSSSHERESKPYAGIDKAVWVIDGLSDLDGLGAESDRFGEPTHLGQRLGEPAAVDNGRNDRSDLAPAQGLIRQFRLDVAHEVGDRLLVVAERNAGSRRGQARAPLAGRIPGAGGKFKGVLARLKCFLELSHGPKAMGQSAGDGGLPVLVAEGVREGLRLPQMEFHPREVCERYE
jgi:hypothetical protein